RLGRQQTGKAREDPAPAVRALPRPEGQPPASRLRQGQRRQPALPEQGDRGGAEAAPRLAACAGEQVEEAAPGMVAPEVLINCVARMGYHPYTVGREE